MTRQSPTGSIDSAIELLRNRYNDLPVVMLHSGRFHPRWAKRSILASPVCWFRYWHGRGSELVERDDGHPPPRFTHNVWEDLRALLGDHRFPGAWFGYFSYDLCRLIEPSKLGARQGDWPLVELGWCPVSFDIPAAVDGLGEVPVESSALRADLSGLESNFGREAYESAVRRVLDYIAAGDVFQVNLAQRFTTEYRGDPRELYERLATISPAWYGAYLELPEHRAILSTSPELFLHLKDGHVVTRPIKGTRPARQCDFSRTVPEELRASQKDTAELNMIVDLMRNDLGRVCSYGSVRVTEPRTVETHPTVHHGVATVEGDLHESKDVVDLLKATLPGGSVTGAPKVRAMQVIDELEPHTRGPYCGAIGYISKHELQLSVAIRTMLLTLKPQVARPMGDSTRRASSPKPSWAVDFSVGGGIVADSDPAAEYEETLVKARPMLAALSGM